MRTGLQVSVSMGRIVKESIHDRQKMFVEADHRRILASDDSFFSKALIVGLLRDRL
jgi:hypothetical protein